MIRVIIVSPNHALRVGLREMLAAQTNIRVTGEAPTLDEINENDADVVLLAPPSSAHLSERHNVAVLFLTDDIESVRRVMGANLRAWGALSMDASEDELGVAIAAVAEGLWVGAPGLVEGLMRLPRGGEGLGDESLVEPLTAREVEVLQNMAAGLANKQIALSLNISEHTVKFHLSSLYAKLGASSRTEAVRRGIEFGLISL